MSIGWAVAVVMAGIVSLLVAGLCFVALRRMERRLARQETTLTDQAEALDDAVRMIEARLDEVHSAATGVRPGEQGAGDENELVSGERLDAAIAPEIQAVIAAATVAVAGKNSRLRSARLANPVEDASAWSQQGRVLVQGSHNMRPTR